MKFVEKYSEAMIILKKNINSLNCPDKISIFETDILQPNGFNKFKVKEFDLIFLDPPFKETNIDYIIKNIYKFEILKKNGLIKNFAPETYFLTRPGPKTCFLLT